MRILNIGVEPKTIADIGYDDVYSKGSDYQIAGVSDCPVLSAVRHVWHEKKPKTNSKTF
jgi:hypothetical protein